MDNTGDISMNELMEGFNRIRRSQMSVGRLTACLAKAFEEADEDNSGYLSMEEFTYVFGRPGMRRKLKRLGIDETEQDRIFAAIDEDGSGEVCVDEVVEGFIKLRNPNAGD